MKLSDYRGKYVVLEWTNPECPYVRRHYNSGNMPELQKEFGAKDVVWLTVNSTNQSSSEFKTPQQMAKWMGEKGAAPKATLIDKDSKVGKLYDARTTPHMYIIDPQGKLIYAGAIDDKRWASAEDDEAGEEPRARRARRGDGGQAGERRRDLALRLHGQVLKRWPKRTWCR